MIITMKGVPPSLNRFAGRKNLWNYRGEKAKWTELVELHVLANGKPREPFRFAEVKITYYFPTRRRHDPDNYSGKLLLDGLTRAGVIVDDDFRHIRLTVAGAYDKEHPRTVIEVQEKEEAEK